MKQTPSSELCFRLQSYDRESLKQFNIDLKFLLKNFSLKFSSINLPVKRKKITVLKSPHVNKKAKERYEMKTFNALIFLKGNFFQKQILEKVSKILPCGLRLKILYTFKQC